jgi:quinol monooxygenase YgiN
MEFKKDKVKEAADLFKRSVLPLCKKQAGFTGAYYMTDSKTGGAIAITFWVDEQAMLASEENRFFQEQVGKFVQFFSAPPIRETYELTLKRDMKTP